MKNIKNSLKPAFNQPGRHGNFLVNLHRFPDGHTTYFTLNVIVQQCKDGRTARQTKTERDRQRETYFIRKNRQTGRQTDTQAQRYRRRTDRRIDRKIDRWTDKQR